MSDFYNIDGNWYHGPWWKRVVNPILRTLQFWTDRPYVVYSQCDVRTTPPTFLRYGFGRIRQFKRMRYRIGRYRR